MLLPEGTVKVLRTAILISALSLAANVMHARGPLRVSTENPRYFTDDSGEVIYLVGAHTWSNLVDMSPQDPPQPFDFAEHLAWLKGYGHNFMRMWTWELSAWSTEATGDKRLLNVSPLGNRRESRLGLENLSKGP